MPEDGLPIPDTRSEALLNNIATGEGDIDKFQVVSDMDKYLYYIAKNGGCGKPTEINWGDIKGNIVNQTDLGNELDSKASTTNYTATLSVSDWTSSAPYTQTVSVDGILLSDTPISDVTLSTDTNTAIAQMEAWSCISNIVTSNGSITAVCFEEKPTIDIPIKLKVVR